MASRPRCQGECRSVERLVVPIGMARYIEFVAGCHGPQRLFGDYPIELPSCLSVESIIRLDNGRMPGKKGVEMLLFSMNMFARAPSALNILYSGVTTRIAAALGGRGLHYSPIYVSHMNFAATGAGSLVLSICSSKRRNVQARRGGSFSIVTSGSQRACDCNCPVDDLDALLSQV